MRTLHRSVMRDSVDRMTLAGVRAVRPISGPVRMREKRMPVVGKFLTLGGAHVILRSTAEGFAWECEGCTEKSTKLPVKYIDGPRRDANEHAGQCRSIPQNA